MHLLIGSLCKSQSSRCWKLAVASFPYVCLDLGGFNVFTTDVTLRLFNTDIHFKMNSCHGAFWNRPHSPGTSWTWSKWNSSRVQKHRSHNISEAEWTWERTVARYLRTASSAEKRSKVIGGTVSPELKKESRTIFTSEAVGYFLSGDGRYLRRTRGDILHFGLKALRATKWIFDLGLLDYITERWDVGQSKTKICVHCLADFFSIKFVAVWRHGDKHTTVQQCGPLHSLSG